MSWQKCMPFSKCLSIYVEAKKRYTLQSLLLDTGPLGPVSSKAIQAISKVGR